MSPKERIFTDTDRLAVRISQPFELWRVAQAFQSADRTDTPSARRLENLRYGRLESLRYDPTCEISGLGGDDFGRERLEACDVGLGRLSALERPDETFKNDSTVLATKDGFAGTFRVWHQARHITSLVANPCDIVQRAVRIRQLRRSTLCVDILPEDLISLLELRQSPFIGKVTTFTMCDGQPQQPALGNLASERRFVRGRLEKDVFAAELERTIADEGARKQTGFAQNLETVANARTRPSSAAKFWTALMTGLNLAMAPVRR